ILHIWRRNDGKGKSRARCGKGRQGMKRLLLIALLLLLPCVAVGGSRGFVHFTPCSDMDYVADVCPETLDAIIDARVNARLTEIVAALRENAKETAEVSVVCVKGNLITMCNEPILTENAVESGRMADAIERAMK
ncbi:MAG: hypothetical protein KKB38_20555, partial [Gammaproteobacteria bacterium]|nr:hypothetical protein [Gammaproteobacteria bacterium]